MSNTAGTGRFASISDADLAAVGSYADAARIVESMREDLIAHPGEWENSNLERFLDALAAVLESLPRNPGLSNRDQDLTGPAWQVIAGALVGASGYE
ncbi:DUF7660 family protein [Glycomyces paridis]|uniref:DUF7660 domain-containing protein n=1 Tax=Glycomyces paridis TaxID=2126555 RepID=A0A4S8PM17_9ACTN|nr:hypothetical protein [Glycomyces paridis]THV30682.1 hypothetical protein E9998_04660 [Glycomyces paridis]